MSDALDGLFNEAGEAAPAKKKAAAKKPAKEAAPAVKEVAETVEDAVPATPKRTVRKAIIFVDEVPGQPNYVTASRNGKTYQIMRGVEVTVPLIVVDILNKARANRVIFGADGSRKYLPYHTHPFRVLGYVDEEV